MPEITLFQAGLNTSQLLVESFIYSSPSPTLPAAHRYKCFDSDHLLGPKAQALQRNSILLAAAFKRIQESPAQLNATHLILAIARESPVKPVYTTNIVVSSGLPPRSRTLDITGSRMLMMLRASFYHYHHDGSPCCAQASLQRYILSTPLCYAELTSANYLISEVGRSTTRSVHSSKERNSMMQNSRQLRNTAFTRPLSHTSRVSRCRGPPRGYDYFKLACCVFSPFPQALGATNCLRSVPKVPHCHQMQIDAFDEMTNFFHFYSLERSGRPQDPLRLFRVASAYACLVQR